MNLIHGYRQRGHLFTKTNPVRQRRKYMPTLDIANFGLEPADLETVFQAGNEIGIGPAKLKDIIAHSAKTGVRPSSLGLLLILIDQIFFLLYDADRVVRTASSAWSRARSLRVSG